MKSLFGYLNVVGLALLISSCISEPTSVDSERQPYESVDGSFLYEVRNESLDSYFSRISVEYLPGFGGFFLDSEGIPNVYLTNLNEQDRAISILKPVLEQLIGPSKTDLLPIKFIKGDYSFSELDLWRRETNRVIGNIPGVIFSDANESRNRVVIAVASEAARSEVVSAISRTQVPPRSVLVKIIEPEIPTATLRDPFPVLVGGIEIKAIEHVSGASPGCTLGFNATHYAGGYGFITNSHCTGARDRLGENNSSVFYQPNNYSGARIGEEGIDLPFDQADDGKLGFSIFGPRPCPGGSNCRLSDAAWIRYDIGIAHSSEFARPETVNTGSITLDTIQPTLPVSIYSAGVIQGDSVHKIGFKTGWTSGVVINTCVDYHYPVQLGYSDVWLMCQNRAVLTVGPGDSGAPVFKLDTGGVARIAGINFAGSETTSMFSPINNIQAEHRSPSDPLGIYGDPFYW